jgi:hypothetical protein
MKSKKINIKSIAKILGFAVLVILFMSFNVFYSKTKELADEKNKKTIENFTGEMSYNDCVGKGYSKEFCVQTPTSVLGPSGCMCPNGSLGHRIPGFRGRCVCDDVYTNTNIDEDYGYNSDLI